MSRAYIKPPHITFAIQALTLKQRFPESNCRLEHHKLVWQGNIQPTPLSRSYSIKVICRDLYSRPKVILYGDSVLGIERPDFPHHFAIDKEKMEVELCLHMPFEFNHTQLIADTIILWAQEWLYFYEIWLATGEWRGGGHTPRQG